MEGRKREREKGQELAEDIGSKENRYNIRKMKIKKEDFVNMKY